MQLLSILESPPTSVFDMHVEFQVEDYDDMRLSGEALAVAEWVSNTFEHGFVLLEFASKLIAGGSVDNKLSWDENWSEDQQYHRTNVYQLRGARTDISLFFLKFNIGNLT